VRALTICQPYAHLIVKHDKRVENRTWSTSYRGPLAIHAGKSRSWLDSYDFDDHPDMVFGAIVGVARLVTCRHIDRLCDGGAYAWVQTHPYTCGPWCWVLDSVVALPEPLPATGHQGLWTVPDNVAGRIRAHAA